MEDEKVVGQCMPLRYLKRRSVDMVVAAVVDHGDEIECDAYNQGGDRRDTIRVARREWEAAEKQWQADGCPVTAWGRHVSEWPLTATA